MSKYKVLALRVSPELHAQVKRLAEAKELKISAWVRLKILQGVSEENKEEVKES